MKRVLILIVNLVFVMYAFSQTDSEKQEAYNKGRQAIQLMDDGKYEESIKLFKECCKLDPENHIYPYEIGYALILQKKYKKAAKCFEKVIKMEGAYDQCYQMLGNAYSIGGNRDKAIDAYERGLDAFPNSGRLYLEIGNVHQDDWNKALEYYEQGVRVDPQYPSNYYWLARIFCNSTEEMWGMLYGEMFINLERGSMRTEEISQLLFDTYKSEIQYTSDTTMSVSFCQNHTINVADAEKAIPFSLVYEPGLMLAATTSDSITLESLNKIRAGFINYYNEKEFKKSHPNVIFHWHQSLIEKGYFECYNYWLLMQGATEEFNAWYVLNEEKFNSFINWFSENPMPVDKENNFHRLDYQGE